MVKLLIEASQPESNNSSNWLIPVIIVISLLLIAVIVFLLFKFVFSRQKMKKDIKDIDHRFNYLHSLLIGQDAQYISRLENISRSNLLYVDIHTKYLKKFKEIRDKRDSKTQRTINHLKDLLDDKRYKELKESISDAKEVIATYEKEINQLNNELIEIIKPEEECKSAIYALKENARRIKNEYYSKQADLDLVKESFNLIFDHLDELFTQVDDFILTAQYDDSKALFPEIESILKQCSNGLNELPKLCTMVISIVPDKITSLENAYEIMCEEKYPLEYLRIPYVIKELKTEVSVLVTKIKQFNLKGVGDKLDNMLSRIDEYLAIFSDERKDREQFEKTNDEIYRNVNLIERRFIKLCNNIPEVEKVYVINQTHKDKINAIQEDIDKLGALKRTLDTFIHSSTKQPYSLLLEKTNELKKSSDAITEDMANFNKYLISLKNDSQNAYVLINKIYFEIKESEKTIREINIENIAKKYSDKINRIHELMNEIHKLLFISPINVDEVNLLKTELESLQSEVLSSNGGVSVDSHLMIMAESAVLYANRQRLAFNDVNQLLNQTELLFDEGEFEQAYISAGNVLQKIHSHVEND